MPVSASQMLYWYGNNFTDKTGGWDHAIRFASAGNTFSGYTNNYSDVNSLHDYITHSINHYAWVYSDFHTHNAINVSGYSKVCSYGKRIPVTSGKNTGQGVFLYENYTQYTNDDVIYKYDQLSENVSLNEIDISFNNSLTIAMLNGSRGTDSEGKGGTLDLYALWLE